MDARERAYGSPGTRKSLDAVRIARPLDEEPKAARKRRRYEETMRQNVSLSRCAIAAGILLAGAAHEANAQGDSQALFKDKTVTIMVGAAPGGGLDTYARLLSRHMQKHIPGNPIVIVSNQPGAGGGIVARSLYTSAPKDGTTIHRRRKN